ncbi:hypothetical protein PsYK624_102250 [Phanerochaete sordida]|uniref:Chitin-binding type-4 domain-containing protein n=1 Tax=Phanerochaete sordida TaxID=48140 RepID=A0A9P3GE71_9APHY|nr:hypothetical protein PsYK624_102250 [Phanerochaete sordida]
MLFAAILALASASAAAAAPALSARQTPVGPQCAGLGPGAFDIASNFTLAAWNATGSNANDTGVPLVLGQAGAVDGAEFKILSTWASFPYDDFPELSLEHGALSGTGPMGNVAAAGNVTAGIPPGFIVPGSSIETPFQIYCGVADTDPAHGGLPQLAVFGDTDSFSLCPASHAPLAQTNVVYKPSADNYGEYLFDECYPVKLHIVGLY